MFEFSVTSVPKVLLYHIQYNCLWFMQCTHSNAEPDREMFTTLVLAVLAGCTHCHKGKT